MSTSRPCLHPMDRISWFIISLRAVTSTEGLSRQLVVESRLLNHQRRQMVHSLSADGGTWEEKVESMCAGEPQSSVCSVPFGGSYSHKPKGLHSPTRNVASSCGSKRRRRASPAARLRAPESLNVRTLPQRRLFTAAGPLDRRRECDLIKQPRRRMQNVKNVARGRQD